ncbi:hypothetical protein OIU77_024744 [Salix suchowensis]|uniref:Uncharacterized protein n=1 Tax=Salix suchowensis TaxID=1278906 RepID=A0ABQ9BVK0_9ROSI|nr:hypothetical protein OIU77_024744 [Salix suchowensis]
MEMKILEINLISAQGLKPPSANIRRMQTYAVVWIDPSTKAPNPNRSSGVRVTPEYLSSETTGVSIEIYAIGCIRDALIGTVRLLVSNLPLSTPSSAITTPSCIALQIRRPSGRFRGVINIGANVIGGSDFWALHGASAIGYRDLVGESQHRRRKERQRDTKSSVGEDVNYSCGESGDLSDGTDSTTSSSSTASTVLKDWNRVGDFTGTNLVRSSSDSGGLLCGLLMQRRLLPCLSAQDLRSYGGSQKEN